jgi:hypothetical protein
MDEPIAQPWAPYWDAAPLLAFVEHRDEITTPGGLRISWTLDVVRTADLDRILEHNEPDVISTRPVPTAQVTLALRRREPRFDDYVEGTWHAITLSLTSGPFRSRLYRDLDGVGSVRAYLEPGQKLPAPLVAQLATTLSLNDLPDANATDITSAECPGTVEFVEVVNVGQGNCNALCDSTGAPLLYFDFGGGCLANAKTYPAGLTFCFRKKAPVVLSHWDFDHWYSGDVHATACTLEWFAPNQRIGTRTRKFVNRLKKSKVLRIIPKTIAPFVVSGATFDFCIGPANSKNDTGIACFAAVAGAAVLCPADAEFRYISSVGTKKWDALVATHHGSNHTGSPIPSPAGLSSPIAFSFGTRNSYHHPGTTALGLYSAWRRLDTPAGHIALGGAHGRTHTSCPCSIKTTQS